MHLESTYGDNTSKVCIITTLVRCKCRLALNSLSVNLSVCVRFGFLATTKLLRNAIETMILTTRHCLWKYHHLWFNGLILILAILIISTPLIYVGNLYVSHIGNTVSTDYQCIHSMCQYYVNSCNCILFLSSIIVKAGQVLICISNERKEQSLPMQASCES